MRWSGALGGFLAGAIVATGAYAMAQGYLGTSTLVVNGQTYSGAFTPQETADDLLVPVSQLSQAMRFQYTWTNNTLTINTAGSTPSPAPNGGDPNYPLQLDYVLSPGTAGISSPSDVTADSEGAMGDDPYARVILDFNYRGKKKSLPNQNVQLTFGGTVSQFVVFDDACGSAVGNIGLVVYPTLVKQLCTASELAGYENAPEFEGSSGPLITGPGVVTLPSADFTYVPVGAGIKADAEADLHVFAVTPGTVTVTATDTSNPNIPPKTVTLRFTD